MLNWKASNTQKRASHGKSSGILTIGALKQALIDDKANNHNKKVHLITSGSHFIWGKMDFII